MSWILISHDMPQVFEVADRIRRLGRCAGVITRQSHTMAEAVAIITDATALDGAAGTPAVPRPATAATGRSARAPPHRERPGKRMIWGWA